MNYSPRIQDFTHVLAFSVELCPTIDNFTKLGTDGVSSIAVRIVVFSHLRLQQLVEILVVVASKCFDSTVRFDVNGKLLLDMRSNTSFAALRCGTCDGDRVVVVCHVFYDGNMRGNEANDDSVQAVGAHERPKAVQQLRF